MFDNFIIIILAILIEAFPFVVFGALLSGVVEEFVPSSIITRIMPKGLLPSVIIGSVMGAAIPMCECGSVLIIRRLLKKGFPKVAAITYMLAGPIVNPITLTSTYVAYSWYPQMTLYRAILGIIVAILTGLIINMFRGDNILQKQDIIELKLMRHEEPSLTVRLKNAITHAMDDFIMIFSMLLLGATVTAIFKAFSPAEVFLFFKSQQWISVPAFAVLAFLLSLCSEADAFIASALNGIFDIPSQLAFLTLGPMLDLKLIMMYKKVFQKKVFYLLCTIPPLSIILICLMFQRGL
jgi:uncharacterized membrane protein YraQ (UPF0718 family)